MLYYLLCSLGICWILKYGKILNRIRNYMTKKYSFLRELFKCSMCLGVYSGIFISFFVYKAEYSELALIFPFASSAFCYIMDVIIDYICSLNLIAEKKINYSSDRNDNSKELDIIL